jgi:hypothetical protein
MREISMMSPKDIVTKYGGNKKQIGEAVKAGLLNPTAAEMAGMMIDRIRAAAAQEQRANTTVFEDTFGEKSTPYERPEVPSGGVASLPVDEDMYNMAGGGIVAFAGEDGSEVDLNEITSQINQASGRGMEGNLGRAREFVDIYREMVSGAKRGPAYEEAKKFYEGAQERASKAAGKQRAVTGLLAASKLLSGRGDLAKIVGEAGAVAAPGLQKALDMETAGQEAGLKGRLGLEEKERTEELEAIKGGMGLYGKELERLAGGDKDLRSDRFVKRFVAAAKYDPKLKNLPQEVLEQMGEREFLNLSGASLMRGQAAGAQAAFSGEEVERKRFGDAAQLAEKTIFRRMSNDPRNIQYKELLKTDKDAALRYKNDVIRSLVAEAGGAPPAAPAPTSDLAPPSPKKGNAMFPARGGSKFSVTAPNGQVFEFNTQAQADAYKARIGAK